jgi:hypothetical protein
MGFGTASIISITGMFSKGAIAQGPARALQKQRQSAYFFIMVPLPKILPKEVVTKVYS